MLSMGRLAQVQVAYFSRGNVNVNVNVDYYIVPEFAKRIMGEENDFNVNHVDANTTTTTRATPYQIVEMKGMGMPFDPPQSWASGGSSSSTSNNNNNNNNNNNKKRLKFEIAGLKFYSDNNLYVVIDPIPSSVQPKFDKVFLDILLRDSTALIILAPDAAEMKMSVGSSSEVSAELGPQQWCRRLLGRIRRKLGKGGVDPRRLVLMEPLTIEERSDLLRLSTAVLNVQEGGGIGSLEALALKIPVITLEGSFGGELAKRFGVEEECVAGSLEEYKEKAGRMSDPEVSD